MPDPATIDPVTLKLLGKLKILAKHTKINIDLIKMTDGSGYADQVLRELSNSDDEEMVLTILKLRNRLHLLEAPVDIDLDQAEKPGDHKNHGKGVS